MDMRRGAGGRLRASGALAAALAAALALAGGFWGGAEARPPQRPIEHHATLRNGALMGSAFLIAPGVAITNAHVVAGLRPGAQVWLSTAETPAPVAAELVAASRRMDLAVLRTPAGLLPPVGPADAEGRRGMAVRAAGVDASGGPRSGARLELDGAVTEPRQDLTAYGPGLVVHMPGVRPGFSGGPVLDAAGRLVGMVAAIRPSPDRAIAAASGYAPRRFRAADEAYVLRAADIRREAARLLGAAAGQ